jgi:hypothetical protein
MLAPGRVIVGQHQYIGVAQALGMFPTPFLSAASAAGGRHVPRTKQIDLGLALDDQDYMAIGNRTTGAGATQRCGCPTGPSAVL